MSCAEVRLRCKWAWDVLWSGLGPSRPRAGAGGECGARFRPRVASGPGSCCRTRPLADAGGNAIFVCRSSWAGRLVSSLLQMLPGNDVRSLPAVLVVALFSFLWGGFLGQDLTVQRRWLMGWWPEHLCPCFSSSSCCPGPCFPCSPPLKTAPPVWALGCALYRRAVPRVPLVSSLVVEPPSAVSTPSPPIFQLQDPAWLSRSIP